MRTLDAGTAPGYDAARPARRSRLLRSPLCALFLRLQRPIVADYVIMVTDPTEGAVSAGGHSW